MFVWQLPKFISNIPVNRGAGASSSLPQPRLAIQCSRWCVGLLQPASTKNERHLLTSTYRDDVLCWLLLARPFLYAFHAHLRFPVDLVWFRLSCDHGWIRSGSVNVRKQQNNNRTSRARWTIPAQFSASTKERTQHKERNLLVS